MRSRATALLVCLVLASGLFPSSSPAAGASSWKSRKGVYAVFRTDHGTMVCELFTREAPKTVENFVGLAEGTREFTDPITKKKTRRRLYDGTIFHKVIKGFMILGGDPLGTGRGGIGYVFDDELDAGLKFDVPGRLAMSHPPLRKDMNSSQFFITQVPAHWLDGKHTIFGQLVEGKDVLDRIASVPVKAGGTEKEMPVERVVLEKVEIVRVGP